MLLRAGLLAGSLLLAALAPVAVPAALMVLEFTPYRIEPPGDAPLEARLRDLQAAQSAHGKDSIYLVPALRSLLSYHYFAGEFALATQYAQRIRPKNLDFGGVDLVTLSTCDTAVGGGHDETGREIEGFGALLQNQGAKGVVASLWPVADHSTARFMELFYSAREQRLRHPFFWAPFILMGNWL